MPEQHSLEARAYHRGELVCELVRNSRIGPPLLRIGPLRDIDFRMRAAEGRDDF